VTYITRARFHFLGWFSPLLTCHPYPAINVDNIAVILALYVQKSTTIASSLMRIHKTCAIDSYMEGGRHFQRPIMCLELAPDVFQCYMLNVYQVIMMNMKKMKNQIWESTENAKGLDFTLRKLVSIEF
jgi:hypothetical protein